MNLQWWIFFDKDKSVEENIKESLVEINKNPMKFCRLMRFFFLQICLGLFILIFSVLLPIWILYG
jgi:hypothetical protein